MKRLNRSLYSKVTGIYKISNKIDNRVYIGSSTTLYERTNLHIQYLKKGIHHSAKLQRFCDKHSISNLFLEIIELCEKNKETILKKEQYWIDYYDAYNKGFNCTPFAKNNMGLKHSKKTLAKMLISQRNRPKSSYARGWKHSKQSKFANRLKHLGKKHKKSSKEKNRKDTLNRIKKGIFNYPNLRISEKTINKIRALIKSGISQNKIAKKFNITQSYVSRLKNKNRRKRKIVVTK